MTKGGNSQERETFMAIFDFLTDPLADDSQALTRDVRPLVAGWPNRGVSALFFPNGPIAKSRFSLYRPWSNLHCDRRHRLFSLMESLQARIRGLPKPIKTEREFRLTPNCTQSRNRAGSERLLRR